MARPQLDHSEELMASRKALEQVGRPQHLMGLAFGMSGLALLVAGMAGWLNAQDGIALGMLFVGWCFEMWAALKRRSHDRTRMTEPTA